MINDSGIGEPELQLFFEENPEFLFHGLANNYKDYFPHIVLKSNGNDDLIPDFILKRTTDDYYDILDIKLPDKTLIVGQKNRRKYSSEVESAIAQVREYREYFNDPSNRQYIEDKYGIAVLKPNIIVLIGKDIYPEERLKVNEIYSSEIEIFTYDQMVKCLEKFLLELEKYKF